MLRKLIAATIATTILLNFVVSPVFADTEDIDQTVLGDVKLIPAQSGKTFPKLHGTDPQVIFYFVSGAEEPSCGITLGKAPSSTVLPILDVIAGETFPYCLEVSDAASFTYGSTQNYVFKYSEKDAPDKTSTNYYFARKIGNQIFALGELNGDQPPTGKSIDTVVIWAKAKLGAPKSLTPDDNNID